MMICANLAPPDAFLRSMPNPDEQPYPLSDLELARCLERAEAESNARFVEARAKVFPDRGAAWIEVAGAYAMFDGPSSPCTQTFGLGLFDPVETADLEKLERFFFERGAAVCHEVCPMAGVTLMATLNERGYRPIEVSSVLYRAIHRGMKLGLAHSERIRVRRATPKDGLQVVETMAAGWSHLQDISGMMRELADVAANTEGLSSFLVELDGEVIATGSLAIRGEVAQLAGACTIPQARKQGAQLALLEKRLQFAAEQGCNLATMAAEPGSASHAMPSVTASALPTPASNGNCPTPEQDLSRPKVELKHLGA
jgi:GNAT superfamily N-acetyltransferase